MSAAAVAELLWTRVGLEAQSLGPGVLPKVMAKRMRVLGLTDAESYAVHLADSPAEFAAFVDDIVVPETWFFRGGALFAFLTKQVRGAIASALSNTTFRVLSAPCSTGEEPYSLAMALTEAGVPGERWTIEGIDLSARSLEGARCAHYTESAFRETPADVRRRYFRKTESGWGLDAAVHGRVRFRQGNLLDPLLLAGERPFDLIFCRNLLIYLHAEARARVLANLDRLLASNGLLCMGHAEPWSLLEGHFQATGPSGCFLFRRKSPGEVQRPAPAPSPRLPPAPPLHAPRTLPAPKPAPAAPPDLLRQAREEADAGALDEALRSCQTYLSAAEPSADAYSLLGVIHQARKEREQAATCFRKALYLDPRHEEALLHLMLLHQEDGDADAATRLRRRLGRTSAGGDA